MRFLQWATAASWAVLAACASCPAQSTAPAVPVLVPAPVPDRIVDETARGTIVLVPRREAIESSVRGTRVLPIIRRGDLFELAPAEPAPAPHYIDPPLPHRWRLEPQPRIMTPPSAPQAPGSGQPSLQMEPLRLTRPGTPFLAPAPAPGAAAP